MSRTLKAALPGLMAVALTACHQPNPQPIEIAGVKNAVQDDRVYIAGAPTEAGLREMKSRGVTTVIDLRGEQEGTAAERTAAESLGLNYIHIPMKSDDITSEQAGAIIDELTRHQNEKVLLHCAGGNRAGAAYGVYLGATRQCGIQDALNAADKAGLKNEMLRHAVRKRIDERR